MAPAGALVGGIIGGAGLAGGTGGLAAAATGAGLGATIGGAISPGEGFFGGGEPEAQQQRIESLTDDQKVLLSLATEQAIKEIQKGRPKFQKSTVVGPSKIQRQIFQQVEKRVLPQIKRLPQQTRQLFEQQIADPARQQFLEETAPRLAQRFQNVNALSSSAFNRQAAQQARELEEGLARQAGALEFQARQEQLPRYLTALGVGEAQRNLQQAQRTGELQQFIANQVAPPPGLSLVGNPLGVQAFQNLAYAPQPSGLNPLLGLLSQQAVGSLFSGGLGQAAPGAAAGAQNPMLNQFSSFGLGGIV